MTETNTESKANGTNPKEDEGATFKAITKKKTGMDLWYNPEKLERLCFPQLRKGNSPAQIKQAKEDIQYLIGMGLESGANPFFKEIMAYRTDETQKTRSELVIMFSINFMLERAEMQPGYLSHFMQAVYEKDVFLKTITMDGVKIEHKPCALKGKDERGRIVLAYAIGRKIVGSRIETFYQEVDFPAFTKENAFWKRDPEGQITKCALAKLLRHMFPGVLKRAYIEAEMANVIDVEAIEAPKEPPSIEESKIDIPALRAECNLLLAVACEGKSELIEEKLLELTGKPLLSEIDDALTLQILKTKLESESDVNN